MANDDHSRDQTQIARMQRARRSAPVEDDATNPLQQAAPAEVRERFQRALDAVPDDERTVERAALDPAALARVDPEATFEIAREDAVPFGVIPANEEATVARPAPARPVLPSPPSTSGRPEPASGRRPPTQLQPRRPKAPTPAPLRIPHVAPVAPNEETVQATMDELKAQAGSSSERAVPVPAPPPPVTPRPPGPATASPARVLDADEQLRRLGMTRRSRPNANHVAAHSGFYSLPEANVIDVTVVENVRLLEAIDTNRDLLGLIAAVVGGVVVGGAILALALSRWAAPGAVMAWTLLGMALCAGLIGLVVVPRDVAFKLDGLRRAFLPMGISAALLLVVGLAWQIGPIRNALRGFAPQEPEISARVLADGSMGVALSECLAIAPLHEYGEWRAPLLESLAGRAELSSACLAQLDPAVADALSASLASRWHKELLRGGVDEERSCAVSESLASLTRPSGEVETRLLSCVLDGDSVAQACCGRSLAAYSAHSPKWVSSIREQTGYVPDERAAAGLLALAFHRHGVTESQLEFVKSANFDGPEGRRLAASFACEAVRNGAAGVGAHLRASIEGHCALDVAAIPGGRELWVQVCEGAEDRMIRRRQEPREVLCESATVALMTGAIAEASRMIGHAATDRTRTAELAGAIHTDVGLPFYTAEEMEAPMAKWAEEIGSRAPPSSGPGW